MSPTCPRLTHTRCCEKVCFVCGNEWGKGDRKITAAEVLLIKEHIMYSYNPSDDRFDIFK